MREYNKGVQKENEAIHHLRDIYDDVIQTPQCEFYDFAARLGTTKIFIEVKWVECRYKTANIYIRWNQAMKLIKAKDFMLYIMTVKGNFFISPTQFFQNAHIHYQKLNPLEKTIAINAIFDGNQFNVIEPQRCLYCLGKIGPTTLK